MFRLAQDVSNSFKGRNCTIGVFLDVKSAFDSVWRNGLKSKIKRIGLSQQIEKLLFSFLDGRTLRVFIDNVWSEGITLGAGVPQGSSLSPILYLIFVNDLPNNLNLLKLSVSQFADDVAIWSSNSSVKAAEADVAEGLKSQAFQ